MTGRYRNLSDQEKKEKLEKLLPAIRMMEQGMKDYCANVPWSQNNCPLCKDAKWGCPRFKDAAKWLLEPTKKNLGIGEVTEIVWDTKGKIETEKIEQKVEMVSAT